MRYFHLLHSREKVVQLANSVGLSVFPLDYWRSCEWFFFIEFWGSSVVRKSKNITVLRYILTIRYRYLWYGLIIQGLTAQNPSQWVRLDDDVCYACHLRKSVELLRACCNDTLCSTAVIIIDISASRDFTLINGYFWLSDRSGFFLQTSPLSLVHLGTKMNFLVFGVSITCLPHLSLSVCKRLKCIITKIGMNVLQLKRSGLWLGFHRSWQTALQYVDSGPVFF